MAFRKLIEMIRYFFTRRLRKETEEYLQDSGDPCNNDSFSFIFR